MPRAQVFLNTCQECGKRAISLTPRSLCRTCEDAKDVREGIEALGEPGGKSLEQVKKELNI